MNTVTFHHLPISICTPACVNLYNSLLNEYYHLPISICTSTCANLYNSLVNQYCHLPKQQHCWKSFFHTSHFVLQIFHCPILNGTCRYISEWNRSKLYWLYAMQQLVWSIGLFLYRYCVHCQSKNPLCVQNLLDTDFFVVGHADELNGNRVAGHRFHGISHAKHTDRIFQHHTMKCIFKQQLDLLHEIFSKPYIYIYIYTD